MNEPVVTAVVAIVPREREVLSWDAGALTRWVESAFAAPCEVRAAPTLAGSRVRAEVVLSTRHEPDRALLAARPHDKPLWKAWVEASCVGGFCDVLADVVVQPALQAR